jgi:hypothetical protein
VYGAEQLTRLPLRLPEAISSRKLVFLLVCSVKLRVCLFTSTDYVCFPRDLKVLFEFLWDIHSLSAHVSFSALSICV